MRRRAHKSLTEVLREDGRGKDGGKKERRERGRLIETNGDC